MEGDILKKHYFNNIIESDNKTKIINRIYNDFLNRDVDESGICSYYDCTENEDDILKIIEEIHQSEEFKSNVSSKVSEHFRNSKIELLHNIYKDHLNRDADESGIQSYYNCTEKEDDIFQIVRNIHDSAEYKDYINNKINKEYLIDSFPLKEKYNSIIPKNIFQTWCTKDLPPKMKENMELLKQQNPEFRHFLFDDDDCREFIQDNFSSEVMHAFDSLIPGAYKADLWRYCVLYIYGGIYLDIKFHCTNGFKLIAVTEEEHFARDRPEGCLYNGFISVLPKNEILLKCIHQIISNVKTKYYGDRDLFITGPGLLGSYFTNEERLNLELNFFRDEEKDKELILYKKQGVLKRYKEYREEQKLFQKSEPYGKLWIQRNIYAFNSIIPKNIFQTWYTKDLPPKMKQSVDLLKKQNPEFNHFLFDDEECREFIQDNFELDVLKAFDSLIPGAFKADLWRYCVLYIYGGVYLDIKFHCVNNFKLVTLTEEEHFARDYLISGVYNAVMITLPKNEILLKCINQIVSNVKSKYYGPTCLHPTGPALLGTFFTQNEKNAFKLFHIEKQNERGVSKYVYCNTNLILENYTEYFNEHNKHKKVAHYGDLWNKKNIYCEPKHDYSNFKKKSKKHQLKIEASVESNNINDTNNTNKTNLNDLKLPNKHVTKIHLVCKDKNKIDEEIWKRCINKYKKIYLNYEVCIYDYPDIYNIIQSYYPKYLDKIKQIKVEPILIDVFRYLILYVEGGIFSEMDCEPLKHIGDLFDTIYYHGDRSRENNFYIYPQKETLVDMKWDYYVSPCCDSEFVCGGNISTYKCLGHDIGETPTILFYEISKKYTYSEEFSTNSDKNSLIIEKSFIITDAKQDIFFKMFMHCVENIDILINFDESNIDRHNEFAPCGSIAFTKMVMNNLSNITCVLASDIFCIISKNGKKKEASRSSVGRNGKGKKKNKTP
jgi:mannosyltransferase OCH1-like enzyme